MVSAEVTAPTYLTPEDIWHSTDFEQHAADSYAAYVQAVGGTTWDGKPIPNWFEIKARQRNGWRAAHATALLSYLSYEREAMTGIKNMFTPSVGNLDKMVAEIEADNDKFLAQLAVDMFGEHPVVLGGRIDDDGWLPDTGYREKFKHHEDEGFDLTQPFTFKGNSREFFINKWVDYPEQLQLILDHYTAWESGARFNTLAKAD